MDFHCSLEPGSFSDRVVIVTGGAGAIGRALCHEFAAAGASVVVNDLGGSSSGNGSSSQPAEEVAAAIRSLGFKAVADTHSVTDADKIIDTALREFGKVDVVINNAGIIAYKPFEEMTSTDMKQTLDVNILGPMLLCHRVWPLFQKQNYGRIVNISSTIIFGYPEVVPYSTSKAGILGLTKSLAAEGSKHNIKVNAVGPSAGTRMALPGLKDEGVRDDFRKEFPVEGNLAIILALATDKHDFNGEFFAAGNFRVSRILMGIAPGLQDVQSVQSLLESKGKLVLQDQKIFPMHSTTEFVQWQRSREQVETGAPNTNT